jgi:hypothetical protein
MSLFALNIKNYLHFTFSFPSYFLDSMKETNLPDIFHQFLASFSTLLSYCALDPTFISFVTCRSRLGSKGPPKFLQEAPFLTFYMGDCKGLCDQCHIATMASPPLVTCFTALPYNMIRTSYIAEWESGMSVFSIM